MVTPSTWMESRPLRLLAGVVVAMLALTLVQVTADDVASVVDGSTYLQDTPGELDYAYLMNWTIWSSDMQSEPSLNPGTDLVSQEARWL